MYKVILQNKVEKFLEKHRGGDIVHRFYKSICILEENPFENNLDIKRLSWYENDYRLRIWKYRFKYEIILNEVLIDFYDADTIWDTYKK